MCDCGDDGEGVSMMRLVVDRSTGDEVCQTCGVVVQAHVMDEAPEWRSHDAATRTRVGSSDPFLDRLGTFLTLENHRGTKRRRTCRDPRDGLADALATIESCVGDLGLSRTCVIAGTAKQLFVDLHEARGCRTDARRALAAAAVYHACKLEGCPRELSLVADACGVDHRALGGATREFKDGDLLADKPYYSQLFDTLAAGPLIDSFLDRLRLSAGVRARVWRAAHRLDDVMGAAMDCGRKPRTICSGILMLALQAEGVTGVGKREVTAACGVCQQTLDKVVTHIKGVLGTADATTPEIVPV